VTKDNLVFDEQLRPKPLSAVLRMMAMIEDIEPPASLKVQLWKRHNIDGIKPSVAPLSSYHKLWYPEWKEAEPGQPIPYILNFNLTAEQRTHLVMVSLVKEECEEATNLLRVWQARKRRGMEVAICSTFVNANMMKDKDKAEEWLHLLKATGADGVRLHALSYPSDVQSMLEEYSKMGLVELANTPGPPGMLAEPSARDAHLSADAAKRLKLKLDMVIVNDCFYHWLARGARRVLALEMGQVVVPAPELTLASTVKASVDPDLKPPSVVCFRFAYFFIPAKCQNVTGRECLALENYKRSRRILEPGMFSRCLFDSRRVVALNQQYPWACAEAGREAYCGRAHADPEAVGKLHHYATDCLWEDKDDCLELNSTLVEDRSLERYRWSS